MTNPRSTSVQDGSIDMDIHHHHRHQEQKEQQQQQDDSKAIIHDAKSSPDDKNGQHKHKHNNALDQKPQEEEEDDDDAAVVCSRGWRTAKHTFSLASLLLSVVALALAALSYIRTEGYAYDTYTSFVVAPCAICWALAEIITTIVRRRRRGGIHPGAHVAAHLLLWIGLQNAVMFDALDVQQLRSTVRDAVENYAGWQSAGHVEFVVSGMFGHVIYAQLVANSILLTIHLALFVRACVETHRRRRPARAAAAAAAFAARQAAMDRRREQKQQQQQQRQRQEEQSRASDAPLQSLPLYADQPPPYSEAAVDPPERAVSVGR